MAEEWNAMRTPLIHQHFILGHPRVLLSFLRFIDEHNELVEPEDVFDFKLPDKVIEHYKKHPSVQYPVAEFQQNVQELLERMEAHRRPSEPKLQ
jgi:lysine/ornithine N-monooxygenase